MFEAEALFDVAAVLWAETHLMDSVAYCSKTGRQSLVRTEAELTDIAVL